MTDGHTHEIVLRGRLGPHVLGPFQDEFAIDHDAAGLTRLVGTVRDPSHLHGLVAHLASINAQLVSIAPVTRDEPVTPKPVTSNPEPSRSTP